MSIASAAGPDALQNGYDLNGIADAIDFFNVMSYDYYGAWQSDAGEITGPPAPLFMGSPKGTSGKLNQHWTMKYYACRANNVQKVSFDLEMKITANLAEPWLAFLRSLLVARWRAS